MHVCHHFSFMLYDLRRVIGLVKMYTLYTLHYDSTGICYTVQEQHQQVVKLWIASTKVKMLTSFIFVNSKYTAMSPMRWSSLSHSSAMKCRSSSTSLIFFKLSNDHCLLGNTDIKYLAQRCLVRLNSFTVCLYSTENGILTLTCTPLVNNDIHVTLLVSKKIFKKWVSKKSHHPSQFSKEHTDIMFIKIMLHLEKWQQKYKGVPNLWHTVYICQVDCNTDEHQCVYFINEKLT